MIRTEISRDKTCQKIFSLSLRFLLVAFICTNVGMAQEASLQDSPTSPTSEYAELIKSRLDKALRLTGKGFVRLNIELNQAGEVISNDNYFHCTTDNQETKQRTA
jgi:hypothetical protein